MKKITLLLLVWVGLSFCVQAQSYPYKIQDGNTETVSPQGYSVWVLKESQFNAAIADSKELRVTRQQLQTMEEQIQKLKAAGGTRQSLADSLVTDRDYYKGLWKTSSDDAREMGRIAKRNRFFARIGMIGIPIAFIAGLLL